MHDASQSLLERITDACEPVEYRIDADGCSAMHFRSGDEIAQAVMGVLGERDAEVRPLLETARHRADKGSYNGRPLDALESIGDDIDAVLALLGPADTQEDA